MTRRSTGSTSPATSTGSTGAWWRCACCSGRLIFFIHRHAYSAWEGFPNFYGFFGFAAFWVIVIIGKNLRRFLWRPEDYYDD